MSLHFKLPEQNAIAAAARRLIEAGADQEIVLAVLRKGGLSKIDSIRVLSQEAHLPMLEAKTVVHESRAWRHDFPRDSVLHAAVAEAMQALKVDADD